MLRSLSIADVRCWSFLRRAVLVSVLIFPSACRRSDDSRQEPVPSATAAAQSTATAPPNLVVLSPAPRRAASKPLPEYFREFSDLIAIARVGGAFHIRGERVATLRLERILFGPPRLTKLQVADEMPTLGCLDPELPAPMSYLLRRGTKVLVFADGVLTDGPVLRGIDEVPKGEVDPWLERFARVRRAAFSDDRRAEYRQLLKEESWEADSPAVVALAGGNPHSRLPVDSQEEQLTEVLLEQLAGCVAGPTWYDKAERLGMVLLLIGRAERHSGVLSALACVKEAPASYTDVPGRVNCSACPSGNLGGSIRCLTDCVKRRSRLDDALEVSTLNATPRELAALRRYAARRATAGVSLRIQSPVRK